MRKGRGKRMRSTGTFTKSRQIGSPCKRGLFKCGNPNGTAPSESANDSAEHLNTILQFSQPLQTAEDLTQLHPDALFRLAPAFIPEMPSLQHGALGENALLTPRILCTLIAFVLRGASSVCQARTLCSLVRRFVLHHGWCGPLGAQVLVLTVNVAVRDPTLRVWLSTYTARPAISPGFALHPFSAYFSLSFGH